MIPRVRVSEPLVPGEHLDGATSLCPGGELGRVVGFEEAAGVREGDRNGPPAAASDQRQVVGAVAVVIAGDHLDARGLRPAREVRDGELAGREAAAPGREPYPDVRPPGAARDGHVV